MLAYVDIKGLHAALHRVAPVAPKKPTVPILSSLLVEARETDGSVRITASDLDQRLTMRVDASVVAGGSLAYPAEALTALIKNLPGDASQVELSSSGGITAGKSQAVLTTEAGDIYPADMVGAPASRISEEAAGALADAIAACLPAADKVADPIRPQLAGLHLEAADDGVFAVALDGHRLHMVKLPEELRAVLADAGADGVVVPAAAAKVAARLLREFAAGVSLGFANGRMQIASASAIYTARLYDGGKEYPNWRQAMPEPKVSIQLWADELERALMACQAVSDAVRPDLDPGVGATFLRLSAKGVQGKVSTALECGGLHSEQAFLRLSTPQLLQAISSGKDFLEGGYVSLQLSPDKVPAVLRAGAFTAITMPIYAAEDDEEVD